MKLGQDYPERVYAGLLGKVVGVRHGANVEGWSSERIARTFGDITGYVHHFKRFAADDDLNGPLFFIRALEDFADQAEITAEMMGQTWLNYVPDGHGFFWWGGYGTSTEHTAYQNLKNGIRAPRSGSIAQNGATVAEQIGGQIFIDTWGLVAPGQAERAAELASKMASVSHDSNGRFGGMFVAAAIATAFTASSVDAILDTAVAQIPAESEYARMVADVRAFHRQHPNDWHDGLHYVQSYWGYDRYPGTVHIIPNAAIIVLALLYSDGEFSRAINVANMCGWDTDCNVGNVGTITGVFNGLAGIDRVWRDPINDLLCTSSVLGNLNIWDLPRAAAYVARLGYHMAGEPVPDQWQTILEPEGRFYHFEWPGSTHSFEVETGPDGAARAAWCENTDQAAHGGSRSLRIVADRMRGGDVVRAYLKTYYHPDDFNDSRYDPGFSPILYPGQTVEVWVMVPPTVDAEAQARLFVRDSQSDTITYGGATHLTPGHWTQLAWRIPRQEDACLERVGVEWVTSSGVHNAPFEAYLDDLRLTGEPDYRVIFAHQTMEQWTPVHREVPQFSTLRGVWDIQQGHLSGSYSGEVAAAYTGDLGWRDYQFETVVIPRMGDHHQLQVRVQGTQRSYVVGLAAENRLILYKNADGHFEPVISTAFDWTHDTPYTIRTTVQGAQITVAVNGVNRLHYHDADRPYVWGLVGFSNQGGSRTDYREFAVHGLEEGTA